MAEEQRVVILPDSLTVRELADSIEIIVIEVMKVLIANGIVASINQEIDFDTAAIVCAEFGIEALSQSSLAEQAQKEEAAQAQEWRQIYSEEAPEDLERRPPIVTILGHVDHGKTTLLDTIRKTQVVEGEAGGITQHIGAYRARHGDRQITFLDTPGHEAFTAMRARGAHGADVAVLVVAADDGVMPTTREAIAHARAANVPIVVAVTKMDLPGANLDQVNRQLAEVDLVPVSWDGNTMVEAVSGITGEGIEDLLEAILLTSDDNDVVANPEARPSGVVLEAEVDPSRGVLATLLVLNGRLKRGDSLIAGQTSGRIKAMFDESNRRINAAGPSTPVAVMGLGDMPQPGDSFEWVKSDKAGRRLLQERREDGQQGSGRMEALTLDDVFARFRRGDTRELALIVKADYQGSLQPILDSLEKLSEDNRGGIQLRTLAADIGSIGENDVNLAAASNAIVVGFNVDVDSTARRVADSQGVDIRNWKIIYNLLEDIELALHGMLEPEDVEERLGLAEVRQVFSNSRVGNIAGSYVREGTVQRNARARVLRDDRVLADGLRVGSLKRVRDDVREVRAGFECGINLERYNDFQEGDLLEFYVVRRAGRAAT